MSYDALGAAALNYAPCRYGNSRVRFRGPQRRLDAPYVAFIGGTETYGKFIRAPFPALVESTLGINCVNFGVANGGVDVFVNDGFLIDAACGAQATVLQVVGAQNMSNRFYSVHPRRNDRFLKASRLLKSIYPEVDFSECHFTRHMLSMLYRVSEERFAVVRHEVQQAWLARMKVLCRRIHGNIVLLWFADHPPLAHHDDAVDPAEDKEPLFITRAMLDKLSVYVSGLVEVTASQDALQGGTDGMIFNEMEALAACRMMGPKAHGEVALPLGKALQELM